ncbi:MAG: MFS transporter [Verrucomicrobia bacterium]|nr:MFS transporter [Verrucomicrobiota bacterium]
MNILKLWSAILGNLFEHYDAALFGFLSPFLAPLIFPDKEPVVALILTYAMIPLGMIARPIGSLVFGYIGDTYGRRQALFLTLGGMAVVSAGIALSPTFQTAGLLAPLIFCAGRILQNFFSAGETMGGAIYVLEDTPEKKHDFVSSLYSTSTIGGILLASAGVALLSSMGVLEKGWRLLYVVGCITAFFGLLIRRHLPVSLPPKTHGWIKTFWQERRALFFITVAAGFAYSTYTMALVLMNGFIPLITSLSKAQMVSLNTGLLVLDFCLLPFFGWVATRISREKLMLGVAICVALLASFLLSALHNASLFTVIGIRICFVIFGVAFFAPFHAWAQQLVPPAHRYAIISFGYALGSQLLGGPTAAISLWLFKTTGIVSSVSWYWILLAALCFFCLKFAQKKKPAWVAA